MTVAEIETEISKLSPEYRLRLNVHLIADKADEVKRDWKGTLARACVSGAKILLENAGKAIGAGVGIGGVLAATFTLSSCSVSRSQTLEDGRISTWQLTVDKAAANAVRSWYTIPVVNVGK